MIRIYYKEPKEKVQKTFHGLMKMINVDKINLIQEYPNESNLDLA